jgi:hypothetical protein
MANQHLAVISWCLCCALRVERAPKSRLLLPVHDLPEELRRSLQRVGEICDIC